jgi:ABC-type uncharacterized transport system permease subunit
MDERIGLSIFKELAIGSSFGLLIGAATENIYLGIMLGALGGLAIGWLITAIVIETEKSKRRK